MSPVPTTLALAVSLLLVESHPTKIGCDFQVASRSESNVGATTVDSSPTTSTDGAQATASCPTGWVQKCETMPPNAEDGVSVAFNGKSCTATSNGFSITARATCGSTPTEGAVSNAIFLDNQTVTANCIYGSALSCACETHWSAAAICGGDTEFAPSNGICSKVIPASPGRRRNTGIGAGAKIWAICLQAFDSGKIYNIENIRAVGKYLNVEGNGTDNGSNIQLWDNPSEGSSQWKIVRRNSGAYNIESVNATGKYVNVAANNKSNGANIWIWGNPSTRSTQWRIVARSNGIYNIENVNALGKYLNVVGSKTNNGANIQLWDDPSERSTQWRITEANVMVTTANIMGAPPVDSTDMASASTDQFNVGSDVTITFSSAFVMGFAHATAGTFTAPQFSGTPALGTATCQGSQSIRYKDTRGQTNSIVWNAPDDVNNLTIVTLSFASAAGYGSISRRSLTLTKSAVAFSTTASVTVTASTTSTAQYEKISSTTLPSTSFTTPKAVIFDQYVKISSGTCSSNQLDVITDSTTCNGAIAALDLSVTVAEVIVTSVTPEPEACWYYQDRLYFNENDANIGNGASPLYEPICLKRELGPVGASSPSNSDNNLISDNFMVILGGAIGAALVLCLGGIYAYRRMVANSEQKFAV